ncbi:MAG: undecaprenyl-diphosphate phosphatase [Bacteroidota bacterium]
MNVFESIILGIIQGLTEFLPVSSSGHIELGKAILGLKPKDAVLFSAVLHAATALSTIVIYWKDILGIIRDLFRFQWNDSTKFVAFIVISMIPAGIVGVQFNDQLEALFSGQVMLVGFMLLITGGLLMASSRIQAKPGELTFGKAFLVGLSQAFAMLPGVSRSGSTISTALMLGIDRAKAARFSFLMVIPVILGGTALELKDYFEAQGTPEAVQVVADQAGTTEVGMTALIAGFIAAFVSGLLACTWMIRIVKNSKLDYFAFYCFAVGLVAIAWSFFNGV